MPVSKLSGHVILSESEGSYASYLLTITAQVKEKCPVEKEK